MDSVRHLAKSLGRSKFVSLGNIPITIAVVKDFSIPKYRRYQDDLVDEELSNLAVEYLVKAHIRKDFLHSIISHSLKDGWHGKTTSVIRDLRDSFYLNIDICNGIDHESVRSILFLLHFRGVSWDEFKSPSFLNALTRRLSLIDSIPQHVVEDIGSRAKFCLRYLLSFEGKEIVEDFKFRELGFIPAGEIDLVTSNSVIDIRVLESEPNLFDWIHVITYYLLGRIDSPFYEKKGVYFSSIKSLKIINPSKGLVYTLRVEDLLSKKDLILSISRELIFRRKIADQAIILKYLDDIYGKVFHGYLLKFGGDVLLSKYATFQRLEDFFTQDEFQFLEDCFLHFLKNIS
ncbi:hypothetical protein MHC_01175 [Mycoplasma haemocanis str. Illinois]|uniref:Uncharacterized protein n=1 Tax=Mycoplasma haemocanis (strain Illinois) TaxID=1111676 RepID=H6N629_MYCHN|nr:hypothetical protein [Mycoplasma haemocanis]AEW45101.1 hypothetical protein MHC_01175 [Mycoplasma haemocanis str. Illinois]